MKVRVRFNRNVLGRKAGTVDWVEATPIVETLVRVGYLVWLDEPRSEPLPETISAGFDDGPLPEIVAVNDSSDEWSVFDLDILNESPEVE